MKKIALTLAAVASLGVAACSGADDSTGNNAVDTNATETETDLDVNASANDAAAVDATNNALDSAGNTLGNAADAVGNAAEGVANAAENAVD